jgi:hypothetical protein
MPGRFADRLGVITVVLAAFDIGFDVLGWDKTHFMASRGQFASPMVRAATGFHGDLGRRKLFEEGQQLRTAEIDS